MPDDAADWIDHEHWPDLDVIMITGYASIKGAVEAINLDGGGLTTMVVGDQVINRPSDPTGERENGDAILVIAH